MSDTKYNYVPALPQEFKCRVPLPGGVQALVNNGFLAQDRLFDSGARLSSKGEMGYLCEVPQGCNAEETLQIISFRDAANTSDISFSNSLYFGVGSTATILLCTHTLSMDHFNTEEVVEIEVKEKARVNLIVMQNEHNFSNHKFTFNANIEEGGYLCINVVTLHGAHLNNNFVINLSGSEAKCELNGMYLVDGTQKVETKVTMNHLVANCWSSQLFKGILDDESTATFTGRIVVSKDAQKTEAFQANHNLLISSQAKAYAQPQLEIYADDVRCSHGATSGMLDENALFYMRSRGIGVTEAKLLQQLAFVYDVLEKITNEQLRERLNNLVESRLRGEFSRCDNCSMNCC